MNAKIPLKIAIVAVDLRSAWLALELRKLGHEITYIDVSNSLPRPSSDDVEGPFGHFIFDSWDSSFSDLLQFEEPFASQPQGFVAWTSQGPLEYKSSLFEIKNRSMNPLLHRLLYEFNRTQVSEYIKVQSPEIGLQNRFTFRNYTRNSSARLQERLKESLNYYNQIQLRDISFSGKHKVTGLELDGAIKGHQNYDFVVWSLSEDESKALSERIAERLPRRQNNEKLYVWLPFTFKFEGTPEFDALPEHFFLVQDVELQLNQENVFICKKSLAKQQYQIWSLVSYSQQHNPNYLNQRAGQIERILHERVSRLKATLHALPADISKPPEERVPSGCFVWSLKSDLPQSKFENLFINGPDTWFEYSWFENWSKQKGILEAIKSEDEKRIRKNRKKRTEVETEEHSEENKVEGKR